MSKRSVFIVLLSVLLLISIGFNIYFLNNMQSLKTETTEKDSRDDDGHDKTSEFSGYTFTFGTYGNVRPSEEQLISIKETFELRLDARGILDRKVTIDKDNAFIVVEIPRDIGKSENDYKQDLDNLGAKNDLTFCSLKKDESGNAILDNPQPDQVLLSGKHIQKAEAGYQDEKNIIALTFTDEGKKLFEDATAQYINDYIGIFLDDVCISAPLVNSTITDGQAVIEGSFTAEEATELANNINNGALPYDFHLIQ